MAVWRHGRKDREWTKGERRDHLAPYHQILDLPLLDPNIYSATGTYLPDVLKCIIIII